MIIKLNPENDFLCADDALEEQGFKQVGFLENTKIRKLIGAVFEKDGKKYGITYVEHSSILNAITRIDLEEINTLKSHQRIIKNIHERIYKQVKKYKEER